MSKIALSPNASGTALFTIASPATNTDRTLTLPDEGGTVLTDTGLPAELNATGSAPLYACRAWVNFNGTGTVAIRASGNVSSVADNGTGLYTVNFTTAMPDTDYCVTTSGSNNTALSERVVSPYAYTTSSVSISTNDNASALQDSQSAHVAIFR